MTYWSSVRSIARKVSSAEAKAHFSALVAEAAQRGTCILIERRGKPIAALVGLADLERLERGEAAPDRPQGALALVGAWREVGDEALDALIAGLCTVRAQDTGRTVELDA